MHVSKRITSWSVPFLTTDWSNSCSTLSNFLASNFFNTSGRLIKFPSLPTLLLTWHNLMVICMYLEWSCPCDWDSTFLGALGLLWWPLWHPHSHTHPSLITTHLPLCRNSPPHSLSLYTRSRLVPPDLNPCLGFSLFWQSGPLLLVETPWLSRSPSYSGGYLPDTLLVASL